MGFMSLSQQSAEMRRNMVDSQLRTNGVNAPWIMAAMLDVQREDFAPDNAAGVYMDRAIPLGHGRMLNPPLTAGLMLNAADVRTSDKVLLVGAGTGYLAALLVRRCATLVAVEQDAALAQSFSAKLSGVTLVTGPLTAGAPEDAPYDLILIDGGIETLPDALVAQLAEGGRVVTGLIEGPVSRLAAGVKRGAHLALRTVTDTEVAPLPGFQQVQEFVF
jgi:protein-L-isoaspartate(D-aspartate) O-methyltransferase